jgi:hypothetical protein
MMGIAAGLVWDRMDSDKEEGKKGIIYLRYNWR